MEPPAKVEAAERGHARPRNPPSRGYSRFVQKPIEEIAKTFQYEPLPGAVVVAAWTRGGLLPRAAIDDDTNAEQSKRVPIMGEAPSAKHSLEIEKLKLELIYIRRTFFVQVFNAAVILALGVAAIYFFQRPQLAEMEATRLSAERQFVTKSISDAYSMKDPKDRKRMFGLLAQEYPTYESVIQSITASLDITDKQLSPPLDEPVAARCKAIANEGSDIILARAKLQYEFYREVSGVGQSGRVGTGPVAQVLRQQITELDERGKALETMRRELKCAN